MANTIPLRSKINKKFTWNAESVFKSAKEWEAEVAAILADLPNVKKYEGRLGESAEVLLEGMRSVEALANRVYKIFMYAGFSYSVDTTNQKSAALFGKAQGVAGQVSGALSGSAWEWRLTDEGSSTLVERVARSNVVDSNWILRQVEDANHTLDYGVNTASALVELRGLTKALTGR